MLSFSNVVILASFDIDPNEAITFMEGIKEKVYIVTAYYTVVVAKCWCYTLLHYTCMYIIIYTGQEQHGGQSSVYDINRKLQS